jgi:UBX domain-containing protein 7
MDDKSLVAEFVQLTGCNVDEAEMWLEMAGHDVGQAVDLFFSNDQGGAAAGQSGSAGAGASGCISSKNDDFPIDYNPADFEGEPEVRAGDAVVTANLLGDAPRNANGVHNPIANMDHIRALQQQYQASLHPGQAQPPAPPVTVFGNARGTQREQSLADMYKVNSKLLYRGDFDQAREHAKQQDMWLLVSIHADDEFACHVLNRDVWSDELVEEVVQACFVFWYREDKSAEGRFYIERYKVAGAPYLGIIDPRTRGLVKCFQGPQGVPSTSMGMVERCKFRSCRLCVCVYVCRYNLC